MYAETERIASNSVSVMVKLISEPSLRAGDVLVEWNGERVSSIEEFERHYQEQEPGSRWATWCDEADAESEVK